MAPVLACHLTNLILSTLDGYSAHGEWLSGCLMVYFSSFKYKRSWEISYGDWRKGGILQVCILSYLGLKSCPVRAIFHLSRPQDFIVKDFYGPSCSNDFPFSFCVAIYCGLSMPRKPLLPSFDFPFALVLFVLQDYCNSIFIWDIYIYTHTWLYVAVKIPGPWNRKYIFIFLGLT